MKKIKEIKKIKNIAEKAILSGNFAFETKNANGNNYFTGASYAPVKIVVGTGIAYDLIEIYLKVGQETVCLEKSRIEHSDWVEVRNNYPALAIYLARLAEIAGA